MLVLASNNQLWPGTVVCQPLPAIGIKQVAIGSIGLLGNGKAEPTLHNGS